MHKGMIGSTLQNQVNVVVLVLSWNSPTLDGHIQVSFTKTLPDVDLKFQQVHHFCYRNKLDTDSSLEHAKCGDVSS